MINANERVIAGVSGGADSLGLLILLHRIKKERLLGFDFELLPCHVHHNIRGESADRDARMTEDFCERLGLFCRTEYVDVPAENDGSGESMEETARRLRYRAFYGLAAKSGSAAVALAHHMNDQAETVLFNMIRGTGIKGMSGIAPVSSLPFAGEGRVRAIRPLLLVTREEIEAFLISEGVKWCVDETNRDTEYSRNRIRHVILPEAAKINSAACDHIARLASDMREVSDYISRQALLAQKQYVRMEDGEAYLDISIFEKEDRVVYTQVVRNCLEQTCGALKDITAVHVTQVLELAGAGKSGRSVDLPYGVKVLREYGNIVFMRGESGEEPVYDPYLRTIEDVQIPRDDRGAPAFPKDSCVKWFDCDKIGSRVVFRSPLTGDYIVTAAGRKTLSRFFKDQKVPVSKRDDAIVLAFEDGGEVLWVYAQGVSRVNVKYLTDADTKRILEAGIRQAGRA